MNIKFMKILSWYKRLFHKHYLERDMGKDEWFCVKCGKRFTVDEIFKLARRIG